MTGPLTVRQWRGLVDLTQTAVVEASRAVERVHRQTARRTFVVLERVPVVAAPTAVVRCLHDATLTSVYATIRLVASAAGTAIGTVLDGLPEHQADSPRSVAPAVRPRPIAADHDSATT